MNKYSSSSNDNNVSESSLENKEWEQWTAEMQADVNRKNSRKIHYIKESEGAQDRDKGERERKSKSEKEKGRMERDKTKRG